MRKVLLASVLSIMTLGTAYAGDQYVDKSGYAAGGYDVVAYFGMEQNPVGQQQPAPVPGVSSITTEYNGATWAFSSEENRDKFAANPEKYIPGFDGHCAYGVGINKGGKVPGNPNLWRIIDGKLYFNITPTVVGFWEKDINGWLGKAGNNWTGINAKPASKKSWKAIKDNKGTWQVNAPLASDSNS